MNDSRLIDVGKSVSALEQIERLLALPVAFGYCGKASAPAHLRSMTVPGRQKVVRFSCGAWSCRVCGACKRADAGRHYGMLLLQSEGVLFEKATTVGTWNSDSQQLLRIDASWVRVGDAIFGNTSTPMAASVPDRTDVIRRLGVALRSMSLLPKRPGGRCRPIASSHDWKQPDKPVKYKRLGWVRVRNADEVLKRLDAFGVVGKSHPASDDTIWDVTWNEPPEWSTEQRQEFMSELSRIQTLA